MKEAQNQPQQEGQELISTNTDTAQGTPPVEVSQQSTEVNSETPASVSSHPKLHQNARGFYTFPIRVIWPSRTE